MTIWCKAKNDIDWVLGTVYKTEGSAYRKAGAHMLINGFGQHFGLLSGGCLESDIVLNSRKVMDSAETICLIYDSNDEDDIAFQFGLGCGGKVYIMLQLVTLDNDLDLNAILTALNNRQCGVYHQKINGRESYFKFTKENIDPTAYVESRPDGDWLVSTVNPDPHLLIVGGGVDVRPVVNICKELGWLITIIDPRIANARKEHFPLADFIFRKPNENFDKHILKNRLDAVVIMSHSLKIDADYLCKIQSYSLKYVALLGPKHRFKEVLNLAKLSENELQHPVASPAGFDIGGQLPESIALSIVAECHSALFG